MILFFDTETTGLWKNSAPVGSLDQPRMVQIAAILTEVDGTERMNLNLLVKQDAVPIGASNIHGITTAVSQRLGLAEGAVLTIFEEMLDKADIVVAHNGQYDQKIILNALKIHDGEQYRDPFQTKECFCTMLASTAICKIKSQRGGYKWPKLQEAYKFFFGEEFVDAHDALADVRACRDVYFEIQDLIARKTAAAGIAA